MNNEDVHPAGAPTMKDGPPVRNVSGETKTIGSTVRQNRDVNGRFASRPLTHRTATLVDGYGGYESVSGTFMPSVRNNAYLHHPDRTRPLPRDMDYSAGVSEQRKSHAGFHAAQDDLNHLSGCPTCAVGG
jgi:hypothetical protein